MLNPFPHLLDYQFFGPTILRLVTGIFFIYLGQIKFSKDKADLVLFFESLGLKPALYFINSLALAEIVIGFALLIGFLTQIAASIAIVISIVSLVVFTRHPNLSSQKPVNYVMILAMVLSLLIMGAGRLALDLPL